MDKIGQEEFVVIEGDMNEHVGEKVAGYEGVHGGKGYGVRNTKDKCCWSWWMRWNWFY